MNRRTILTGGAVLVTGVAGVVGWRAAAGSTRDYDRYSERLRAPLPPDPVLADLIRQATLAASGHNTQPWRFRIRQDAIDILPDTSRRTPVVDPDDHHLFVSLGCAAENLSLAANAAGLSGEPSFDGEALRYAWSRGPRSVDPLLPAIGERRTCRSLYDGRPVSTTDLDTLAKAADLPGVRMILMTDRPRMAKVRDLVVEGNTIQMNDPAFMAELKHWLRFNPKDAMARGDGLYSASSGAPILPARLGRPAFDRFVTAETENDRYVRHMDSSAGLAVFFADVPGSAGWMIVGRACQRFMLAATRRNIRHAFVNQPVEVAALRNDLAALVGEAGLRPNLVLRFGRGPVLPFSPRRPIETVLVNAS